MSTVTIFVYELLNKLLHNCIFAAGGGLGARTRKKNLKSLGGRGGGGRAMSTQQKKT